MAKHETYTSVAHINATGLEELKNMSETLAKQCEQVNETIEKINSLKVTFSINDQEKKMLRILLILILILNIIHIIQIEIINRK